MDQEQITILVLDQEYKIKCPIEEINSFNGNRYTLIEGDSIHWLLQQSNRKNKYRFIIYI